MTPSEALDLIDKLVAQLKFNRKEHETVQDALQTLKLAIKEKKD